MRHVWAVGILMLASVAGAETPESAAYRKEIETWRAKREERLKADGGWLTVTGLYWLKPGANRVGSAAGSDVVFPASAPAATGTLTLAGGKVSLRLEPGVVATLRDQPVTAERELAADADGDPDVVSIGPLRWHIIKRGARYGVRLKDMDSELRRHFKGLEWYPIAERWRVTARFEPAAAPRTIAVPNVLGQIDALPNPGTAVFTIDGREVRLEPVLESPDADELFFIFRDRTTGKGTYGGGRFLYTPLPKDGQVVLDFNKAYSPPCAFTPHATCPLPPRQNRLPVAIPAGEKFAGH
jgi:uncharacterized protein (DUF1684 family)